MAQLFALFRTQNRFQDIIKLQHISNHAFLSRALIEEISAHQKEFSKFICSQHESIQKIQKLTLMHLLILHAPDLSELFDSISLNLHAEDPWINHNILVPYQNFIRKLILSCEQHQRIRVINNGWNSIASQFGKFACKQQMRQDPKLYFNFQVLCYSINMLYKLFGFLKKVSTLGRYYPKNINSCFISFVKVASYQTALFYFAFKFIVNELLLHHEDYLPGENQKNFFRDILQRDLQPINQGMKEIFLNKYYNPIENGIKVGLLQLDSLPDNSKKALYELKIFQPQNCQKSRKNRQFLRQKIFSEKEFDSHVFEESLNWISSREYQEVDLQELYEKQNVNSLNIFKKQVRQKKRVVGEVLSDISLN